MKGTTPKEKYRRCCGMEAHKETVSGLRVATGWRRRPAAEEGLRHVPQRSGPNAWMAEAIEGDRDWDGVHRGLLAAFVERSGRPRVPSCSSQSQTGKGIAWPQA